MDSLKKLWGWYKTGDYWVKLQLDSNGKVILSPLSSGLIPQYLIAKWDYVHGAIPTGWSLYEAGGYSTDKCEDGTAYATCAYAGYPPSNAFDNDDVTYWSTYGVCSAPTVGIWYDFGEGVSWAIIKVRMKYMIDRGMKKFKIQGSNNGIDWIDLKDATGLNTTEWQEWTFVNTTPYRYIQMIASESWDTVNGYIALYEVEMIALAPAWIIKD